MNPPNREKEPSTEVNESALKAFLTKLRKRHIIETFAGFIAGGWVFLEFVDRILIAHYHINEKWLDAAFFTLLGALLCIILWRWFSGTEKRPGNVKVEVLLVPLIILITLAIDLNLILRIAGIPGKKLLIEFIAFLLGIAWLIVKLYQWAALSQTAPAVRADLQSVRSDKDLGHISATTSTEPVLIRSLAVLPLANLSRDPEQEYFADGMTEELITSLARFSDLRVISRTSSMHFKGTKRTLPEIAKQLHVDGIVEGTVRRAGDRVRISAQLIHAPTDQHVWAESYERGLSDILALQSEVARAIAGEIQLKVTPQERARLSSARKVVPEAYDLYLRGLREYAKSSSDGFAKGLEYFEQSMQKDPDFALSHSALAACYVWFTTLRLGPPKTFIPKVKAAAAKALQLDPTLAEAHASLAITRWEYEWDWAGAETDFKRAIELNPNSAMARYHHALFLMAMGRFDDAISEATAASDLDPVSVTVATAVAQAYLWAGRYDEAIGGCQRVLDLDPENAYVHVTVRSISFAETGRIPEAVAAAESATRSSPPGRNILVDAFLANAYVRLEKPAEALKLLELWENLATQRYLDAGIMPCFYIPLGKMDKAFEWMYRGLEERSPQCPWYNTSPIRPSVEQRLDPRWSDVLRRIGFPPQGVF